MHTSGGIFMPEVLLSESFMPVYPLSLCLQSSYHLQKWGGVSFCGYYDEYTVGSV